MWQIYFSRKYSLLRWEEYLESMNHPLFLKIYKVERTEFLIDGFQIPQSVYYHPQKYNREVVQLIIKQSLNPQGWENYSKTYWQTVKKIYSFTEKLGKLNLNKLRDKDLIIKLVTSREFMLRHFAFGIWGIFILEPHLTSLQFLKSHFPKLCAEEFMTILTPHTFAAHFKEEYLLSKLNLKNNKVTDRHLQDYRWIPCVDLTDEPWAKKDLIARHEFISKQRIDPVAQKEKELTQKFQELNKKLSYGQRKLAKLINQVVYLKDQRDDVRFYATFYIRQLYNQIAKRFVNP